MSSWKSFDKLLQKDNLVELFNERIHYAKAVGVDGITPEKYGLDLEENLSVLQRKALAGTYRFSNYKLRLISKGRGKEPREISVPTVRDRIILRVLNDLLSKVFSEYTRQELPQRIIKKLKNEIEGNNYDAFVKVDVENFYPSIRHSYLLSMLRRKIRRKELISYFRDAISRPAVYPNVAGNSSNIIGVPQGIAISNALSSIFVHDIDTYFSKKDIFYSRYVDDVMVLCKAHDVESVVLELIGKFNALGLVVHEIGKGDSKSCSGLINRDRFDFLGYEFNDSRVSVRSSSVKKIKESIISICTSHKYSRKKSLNYTLLKLNLRITGCVLRINEKVGFFSFQK